MHTFTRTLVCIATGAYESISLPAARRVHASQAQSQPKRVSAKAGQRSRSCELLLFVKSR